MTDRYVVIGHPIAHSKSPLIHAHFAACTGQDLSYERLLAPLDGFEAAVREFTSGGGKGANVTVPFKLEAYALSDVLTSRARAAGAVNTLSFREDRIHGDNTDGAGLVRDLVFNAGLDLRGKRVLLLGAGGAARGVLLPLLERHPAELLVANRSEGKARELASAFEGLGTVRACALEALHGTFDVIINATSASLNDQGLAIDPTLFDANVFAYDMMYGDGPTPFLRIAAERGAVTRDGLGMLIEQAAEAFFVWRGIHPPTAALFSALRA